ncbi:MAG: GerMN domain-containing protein [Treponema sp.]|nr:GerMN domain-containing protein [Treponema sp.]
MLKVLIFWLFFLIFIGCLFLINRERIRSTMQNAHFPTWFSKQVHTEQPKTLIPDEYVPPQEEKPGLSMGSPELNPFPPEGDRVRESESGDEQSPAFRSVQEERIPESFSLDTVDSTALPAANQSSLSLVPVQPNLDVAPRNRFLYFIQLDTEGTILYSKVSRNLPGSDSPLTDVLQALLDGPSQEEQDQGLISLIPGGTKVLSVMIRLETAYINLSEDFLYTPYGSEGYTAQLQQLIWTATEFPTIKDVQLLIEGRKLDYMGDITWIGSPVGRDAF